MWADELAKGALGGADVFSRWHAEGFPAVELWLCLFLLRLADPFAESYESLRLQPLNPFKSP